MLLIGFLAIIPESNGQIFGIKAGATFTKNNTFNLSSNVMVNPTSSLELNQDYKPGFWLGFLTQFTIKGNVYIEPGLNLMQKGYILNSIATNSSLTGYSRSNGKTNFTTNILQIPMSIGYKKQHNNITYHGKIGALIDVQVFSKIKGESHRKEFDVNGNLINEYNFSSINISNPNLYDRFSGGICAEVSGNYKNFELGVGYQEQYVKGKYRTFFIGLGYIFSN